MDINTIPYPGAQICVFVWGRVYYLSGAPPGLARSVPRKFSSLKAPRSPEMALAGSFDVLRNNAYIVMWNRTIEETGVTLQRA